MEYILEQNDKGKHIPKKVGMAPVMRDEASKDRTQMFGDKIFQITEKTGVLLRDWLNVSSGALEAQRNEPLTPEDVSLTTKNKKTGRV